MQIAIKQGKPKRMGRAKDLKPRKKPDRIYATKEPLDKVSRSDVSLRPFHRHVAEQVGKGLSPWIQRLIEREAASMGITEEEWKKTQPKA